MTEREFEVVVWGASGFTGRLVVEYLLQKYGIDGKVRWAAAGRDVEKINRTLEEVGAAGAPTIQADANDAASLAALASRTKVILTTVGPYQKYGTDLVAACVAAGTDYVDLCGEPPWMRRMIDAHHAGANQTGARIVHSCGFDSIPFDLGVHFAQNLFKEAYGRPAKEVKGRVLAAKGGASGGTIASFLATVEAAAKDAFVRKVMRDPYSLAPDSSAKRPRQPDGRTPRYDRDAGKWMAPFVMADINTRNVHRTNMLSGYAYGQDFKYSEMMAAPNAAAAYAIAAGTGGFAGLIAFPPTRAILSRTALPKPGEGPSKHARETGFYKVLFIAKGARRGEMVKALVTGDRDPGYGSTSKLIAESAICLAKDVDHVATPGGVWTPAAAMGDDLIVRLMGHAGLDFNQSN